MLYVKSLLICVSMCVQVCLCWGRISLWEDRWPGQVFLTVALLKPRDRHLQIAQGFLPRVLRPDPLCVGRPASLEGLLPEFQTSGGTCFFPSGKKDQRIKVSRGSLETSLVIPSLSGPLLVPIWAP